MTYNPDIHHRRSIRLRDYDYSSAGAYFVTLCVKNRECLFGEILDGGMLLNDAGRMVNSWWAKIPLKFPEVEIDQYVIMPNHFHCVVVVGADPCVCPDVDVIIGSELASDAGAHTGAPLHRILQWFKTMTTNAYIQGVKQSNWPPFPGKLWQRNYYERVIRNDDELTCDREYIVNNSLKWDLDQENPVHFP